jgi:hypothetical protein
VAAGVWNDASESTSETWSETRAKSRAFRAFHRFSQKIDVKEEYNYPKRVLRAWILICPSIASQEP